MAKFYIFYLLFMQYGKLVVFIQWQHIESMILCALLCLCMEWTDIHNSYKLYVELS